MLSIKYLLAATHVLQAELTVADVPIRLRHSTCVPRHCGELSGQEPDACL